MAGEKLGVSEIEDILRTCLKFGSAIGKAAEDGKIGITDIPLFLDPLMSLPAAIKGGSLVIAELKDMDPAERDHLCKVAEEFDLPQDKIEDIVEKVLKAVIYLGQVAASFRKE